MTAADLEALTSLVPAQDPQLDPRHLLDYDPDFAGHLDLAIRGVIGLDAAAVRAKFAQFVAAHPGLNSAQVRSWGRCRTTSPGTARSRWSGCSSRRSAGCTRRGCRGCSPTRVRWRRCWGCWRSSRSRKKSGNWKSLYRRGRRGRREEMTENEFCHLGYLGALGGKNSSHKQRYSQ